MQLVGIKICVMVGLLFSTFGAACLPLVIMLRYLREDEAESLEYKRSSAYLQRLHNIAKSCLPCLKCCSNSKGSLEAIEDEESKSNVADEDKKSGMNSKFPSLMNCFSGGVFLGTSFIALMPEIREIFDGVGLMWPKFYSIDKNSSEVAIGDEEEGTPMPITEILVTCGLFLILCIEQVVHSITDRDERHVTMKPDSEEVITNEVKDANAVIKVTMPVSMSDEMKAQIVMKDDLVVDGLSNAQENKNLLTDEPVGQHQKDHHDDSAVRSAILVAILTIHSLLEGLAIGLQTKASSTLSIFVAVVFHKSLMAFSMGNNLVQSRHSVKTILTSAAIFASTSPIGIATGIIMKETKSGTEIVHGVLQGIATGTFLFITFFEVLSKEFSNHSNRISKTIAFIFGYGCILVVMFTQHGT